MIVDLLIALFRMLILDPLLFVLPEWEAPIDWPVADTIGGYVDNFNAILPVGELLTLTLLVVAAGLALLPVIAVVWLWGAIRP